MLINRAWKWITVVNGNVVKDTSFLSSAKDEDLWTARSVNPVTVKLNVSNSCTVRKLRGSFISSKGLKGV